MRNLKKQSAKGLFFIRSADRHMVRVAHSVPAIERRPSVSAVEKNHAKAQQFRMTVTQNTNWNGCFLDLWRSSRCATIAPGQPPAREKRCKIVSFVRHRPFRAADLSSAYAMNATKLTVHELDAAIRASGCAGVHEVRVAVLENSGGITIIPAKGSEKDQTAKA